MKARRVVIVGAAGQAREVAYYLREINRSRETFALAGFIVSDAAKVGARDSASEILGDYAWLEKHRTEIDGVILGVGTASARRRIAGELSAAFPDLEWPLVAHPSAQLDWVSAKVGRGVLLAAGVIATVHIVLEDFCMLNFGCTVGHEARVGCASVVNPGANISGGVSLGSGVLVGAGAVVLQYRTVGEGAVVGAGAVVTEDVLPGATVVGVPARPIDRTLREVLR